jgi:hypothetical protein
MLNCDFISNVKLCDMELHTMYYDLVKTFSPPHFYFFLDLVMHNFDSLCLIGG